LPQALRSQVDPDLCQVDPTAGTSVQAVLGLLTEGAATSIRGRIPPMSEPDGNEPVPDGWSDLTEEERAELRRDFVEARERHAQGLSVPLDEVLPRYRRAG
jgi:hypothetical protein